MWRTKQALPNAWDCVCLRARIAATATATHNGEGARRGQSRRRRRRRFDDLQNITCPRGKNVRLVVLVSSSPHTATAPTLSSSSLAWRSCVRDAYRIVRTSAPSTHTERHTRQASTRALIKIDCAHISCAYPRVCTVCMIARAKFNLATMTMSTSTTIP